MSYTPGPWLISNGGVYALDETDRANRFSAHIDGGYVIYSAHAHVMRVRTSIEELNANVRLIAAAPDLLEALVELCRIVEWAIENKSTEDMDSFTLQPAQAAIAKAKGDDHADAG